MNINNNFGISDTICHILLKNIISKAIYLARNKMIYYKLNDHCFNFIMNCIEPFLNSEFIFHENDDEDIIKENNSEKIFYSLVSHNNLNTWIEIKEPETGELDRCLSIKTKIIKISDISSKNNSIKEKGIYNDIPKDNKESSMKNFNRSDNKLKTLKETLEFDSNLYSKNISNEELKQIDAKNNKENIFNTIIIKQKKRKNTNNFIIDLPYYELPKEVYEDKFIKMNNNEENNLLRIEKEKEIINKEQQKNLEKLKNQKENGKIIKNKFIKEIDLNKFTFDSNGNIINLNLPNIDSFSKEFTISNPTITDIKFENIIEKSSQKSLITVKGRINKKFKLLKYNSNDLLFNNKERIKDTKNNKKLEKKLSSGINIISKFKLLNPSFSLDSLKKSNKKSNIKIEYNTIEEEDKKIIKTKNKLPISGSNFDKIIPEVGVVIQNEVKNQIKKGGFEYYNKYNKPSIIEYNQLVNETIKLNNQLILSSLTLGNTNLNIKDKKDKNNFVLSHSDYNGYNQEFTDNNPLLQNSVNSKINIKLKKKNSINNKSLIKNKNITRILFNSFDNKSTKFRNNLSNNIKISNKILMPNLCDYFTIKDNKAFEEENELKSKNIIKILQKRSLSNYYENYEKINKNNNIYSLFSPKRKLYSPNKIPNVLNAKTNNKGKIEFLDEDFIDNFNSNILKNKNWGNNIFSEKNIKIGQEIRNIFRIPKLNISKENKDIGETRKRIPHMMSRKK